MPSTALVAVSAPRNRVQQVLLSLRRRLSASRAAASSIEPVISFVRSPPQADKSRDRPRASNGSGNFEVRSFAIGQNLNCTAAATSLAASAVTERTRRARGRRARFDSTADLPRSEQKRSIGTQTQVVVGNGMVGQRFVELCAEQLAEKGAEQQVEIVSFCEERLAAYNRVKLTSWPAARAKAPNF